MKMDMELDTKGMNCPMPILKAKKAMNELAAGGLLKVLATDPGSVEDFSAFCRTGGHELVETSEADGVFTYVLKKGG
ncbi:MAG: sulfurtransferase TusA family protein [Rhodospirillaceae bacterium]|jgi:tRNA 2-thiouridine synthesizing protein A|nr:sulfurtransferase TusA family protein [Rhodospirillaceae bacterium]MBT4589409.1 sulfurtransferase TusA family protein [Rhodospirillaceae bacterium]MBT4939636.1 sulfurtransferase TusA family protein [Rhodospirillaceae bacterium]MBT7956975.1 sulfurtransferase TusA family protein [Rhodospirillaceae bacterium]